MPGYRSRVEVYVNGSLRQAYTASAIHGLTVGIATASVQVSRDGGAISPGDSLQIKMGLDSSTNWVFNGTVQDRGIAYFPTYYELSAAGQLRKSRRKSNNSDPACVPAPDPDLPTPDPVAYCAMDKTDGEIVTDLLALIGITNVDIEDSGLTLGTINPVQLPTGGSPWSLIQEIDKLTWMRTYDAPDGTVVRRPFSILPSAGASLTLTEGVDIFDGKPVQSLSGMITNAYARGASYIGADDTPINIEFRTDNPDENEFGVSDVEEFSSDLIETFDVAEAWATKTLGELGKLQERIEFTLARGHNEIRAGMTVAIDSATFGYGSGSRFLVEQVRHYAEGVEYLTAVTFRGSAVPEGASANKAPIALFVYRIHHEGTDDGPIDAVYVDGTASYDEDGVIALWVWSGSPETPVSIDGDGKKAVAIYEGGLAGGETITLTVTDNEGQTGTKTLPIVVDADHPAEVRDLWIAASTVLKLCQDGETWDDIAIAAVGVAREANDTYNLAWTSGGAFHRVLVDLTHTLLSPTGITAAAITYDAGGVYTGEAYAGSSSGAIYRSHDSGVTWATQGTIPGGLSVKLVSAVLGTPGGVQALAGDTLWESFDQGLSWIVRKAYGNVAVTSTDLAAGFAHGFIGFAGTGSGADFVQERDGAVTLAFPAPDLPVQVRALTLAGDEPILYVLGEKAGAGKSYIGDATLGGTMVAGAWDTGRDGTPNDAFRDSLTDGLVYVAADDSLVKTMDGFTSTHRILEAVGGEQFLKLGVGKLHAAPVLFVLTSLTANTVVLSLWNGSSNDAPPSGWEALTFDAGAWALPVAQSAAPYSGLVNTEGLWAHSPSVGTERDLFRTEPFRLSAKTPKSATLQWDNDDGPAFIYVNGTLVDQWTTPPIVGDDHPVRTVDVLANLLPGYLNIVTFDCTEGFAAAGNNMGFRLEVRYA